MRLWSGFKSIFATDKSAFSDFWFSPVNSNSFGGNISTDAALRLSAVYACTRILSETIASLPLRVYRKRNDGGKDIVEDSNFYRLLNKRPNDVQNAFEWREMMMGHLVLRGNAYCRILADYKGKITDLIPIHPDRIKLEIVESGGYRYRIRKQDGTEEIVPRGEIWHIRGLSSDGYSGMSPIAIASETFGAALYTQQYGARFFQNDAKPTSGWVETIHAFKSEEARTGFRETMQRHMSGANKSKILVLDNGMKYHEVGVSNKDSQFLELRQFQIVDIARIFRIPPHMIGDLSKSSFSNIEQQSLDFVMHTIVPWAERIESSIEYTLLPDDTDLFVEFDFTNLLRGDSASRASYSQAMVFAGIQSVNEARLREGFNPLVGEEFEKPRQPMNMGNAGIGQTEKKSFGAQTATVAYVDSVQIQAEEPESAPTTIIALESAQEIVIESIEVEPLADPVPDPIATDQDAHSATRMEMIARKVVERVARKETLAVTAALKNGKLFADAVDATYKTHAKYVSESMGIEQEEAELYCAKMRQFLIDGGESAVVWLEEQSTSLLCKIGGLTL